MYIYKYIYYQSYTLYKSLLCLGWYCSEVLVQTLRPCLVSAMMRLSSAMLLYMPSSSSCRPLWPDGVDSLHSLSLSLYLSRISSNSLFSKGSKMNKWNFWVQAAFSLYPLLAPRLEKFEDRSVWGLFLLLLHILPLRPWMKSCFIFKTFLCPQSAGSTKSAPWLAVPGVVLPHDRLLLVAPVHPVLHPGRAGPGGGQGGGEGPCRAVRGPGPGSVQHSVGAGEAQGGVKGAACVRDGAAECQCPVVMARQAPRRSWEVLLGDTLKSARRGKWRSWEMSRAATCQSPGHLQDRDTAAGLSLSPTVSLSTEHGVKLTWFDQYLTATGYRHETEEKNF